MGTAKRCCGKNVHKLSSFLLGEKCTHHIPFPQFPSQWCPWQLRKQAAAVTIACKWAQNFWACCIVPCSSTSTEPCSFAGTTTSHSMFIKCTCSAMPCWLAEKYGMFLVDPASSSSGMRYFLGWSKKYTFRKQKFSLVFEPEMMISKNAYMIHLALHMACPLRLIYLHTFGMHSMSLLFNYPKDRCILNIFDRWTITRICHNKYVLAKAKQAAMLDFHCTLLSYSL